MMKDAKQIYKQIGEIDNRIRFMIAYMQVKIETKDWHAVEDAGSDIRDMESEKKALLWILED
jgi:hypothetical protein